MTSRLLVFGSHGQVGRALVETASESCEVVGLSHAGADICDATAVAEAMCRYRPTSVVNAAAYTKVDDAEREPDLAFHVNRDGARIVAEAAATTGIPIVHLSTDYVFDGRKRVPYKEEDEPDPLGVYGRSKEAGERAVRETNPKHIILRTSWVYSPFGTNFVRTMLRLGAERSELRIVDDQTGCPTSAADIATAVMTVAKEAESKGFDLWGTYHFSGSDRVTWYDFAKLIFEEAVRQGAKAPRLSAISSAEYPSRAPRPAYSILDTRKFGRTFVIQPRPLRGGLRECLAFGHLLQS